MARTSYTGYLRQYGTPGKAGCPATFPAGIQISFDPTQASASTGKALPKGAIPIWVQSYGGGTGGTNPTVDIGTAGASAGLANDIDADIAGASGLTVNGTLLGTELTVDTLIFAGVGASAATGGTTNVVVYYMMVDDGSA